MSTDLLDTTLSVAVPLWIERHRTTPIDLRIGRAKSLADVVASKGDLTMFKGGKAGETANAFNALAEGLALLSFQPGGVTFSGMHWEADQ